MKSWHELIAFRCCYLLFKIKTYIFSSMNNFKTDMRTAKTFLTRSGNPQNFEKVTLEK